MIELCYKEFKFVKNYDLCVVETSPYTYKDFLIGIDEPSKFNIHKNIKLVPLEICVMANSKQSLIRRLMYIIGNNGIKEVRWRLTPHYNPYNKWNCVCSFLR